jgi:hypothetical protein
MLRVAHHSLNQLLASIYRLVVDRLLVLALLEEKETPPPDWHMEGEGSLLTMAEGVEEVALLSILTLPLFPAHNHTQLVLEVLLPAPEQIPVPQA